MKKWMVSLFGSLSLAVALIAISVVATPARLAAQPGSRVCGWLKQPQMDPRTGLTGDAAVIMNMAILVEVDVNSNAGPKICDTVQDKIQAKFRSDPDGLGKSYVNLRNPKFQTAPAYNMWVWLKLDTCEAIGAYFAPAGQTRLDLCDDTNRSSAAKGDQHVYLYTKTFFNIDDKGNLLGKDGQPASAANPPYRLPTPIVKWSEMILP